MHNINWYEGFQTVKQIRVLLNDKRIEWIFVQVNHNEDDGILVQVTKAALKRAYKGYPRDGVVNFFVRNGDELQIG